MESKTHVTILVKEECLKIQPVCPSVKRWQDNFISFILSKSKDILCKSSFINHHYISALCHWYII